MSNFAPLESIGFPLMRANIDTDAIIPGTELMKLTKTGLGIGLFANWRYLGAGKDRVINPEFPLNDAAYQEARILLAGPNFACGSSREPAVWAIRDWGFDCVIAPGFGSIFYSNSFKNGLLPIELPLEQVETLAAQTEKNSPGRIITVDLENCQVIAPGGEQFHFEISKYYQSILLENTDPLSAVMKYSDKIHEFQETDKARRPWIYSGQT
jgi:3-isopropylmalate/(R)-2-methylmalate dehydratase small subunit